MDNTALLRRYFHNAFFADGDMSCRNNLTKDTVQEGDFFEFSCTVAFYGHSQPHLQWSDSFGDITHRRRLSHPSSYDNSMCAILTVNIH